MGRVVSYSAGVEGSPGVSTGLASWAWSWAIRVSRLTAAWLGPGMSDFSERMNCTGWAWLYKTAILSVLETEAERGRDQLGRLSEILSQNKT